MPIIGNVKDPQSVMVSTAKNFIIKCGLGIAETEDESGQRMFSVRESVEADDDVWFDESDFAADDMEDMIKLCLAYCPDYVNHNSVDPGVRIRCEKCGGSELNFKQLKINVVYETENGFFYVCNSCGEIIYLNK